MGPERLDVSLMTGPGRKMSQPTGYAELPGRTENRCYYRVTGRCRKPGIDHWNRKLQFARSGSMQ